MTRLKRLIALVAIAAAAWPLAGWSADSYLAALPSEARVRETLNRLPQVQAARAGIALESANRDRYNAGPYEWTVRSTAQQRRETIGPRYLENDIAIERPLRWFGKAEKDAAIGEQGVIQADAALGDAWHEAARSLLKAWFDWMREATASAALREQMALLERQTEIARKRVTAGDAAKVELLLAETERDRVIAAQRQSAQRAALAALDLTRRFPGIRTTMPADLPAPVELAGADEDWLQHVLGDNHEIALAEAEAHKAALVAERVARDRMPDPTVGVRYAQERGRQEHIVGITVSIPLPGAGRRAHSAASLAQSAVVAERARQTRARVESDAARAVLNARSTFEIGSKFAQVAEQTRTNADLVTRAYALGESNLSDTLLARRQAIEAALASASAQLDALEARARLALDAHHIWALDEEEMKHAPHKAKDGLS